jgi:hypothetical protein
MELLKVKRRWIGVEGFVGSFASTKWTIEDRGGRHIIGRQICVDSSFETFWTG